MRNELIARPDPAFWGEVAFSSLPWAPSVDGQTLPEPPVEAIRAGAAAGMELLVGSNTEETRLFLLSDGSIDRITEESLSRLAAAYGLSAEGLNAYRAAYPGASAGDLFSTIQTDWYWRIPAVRMADAHAARARAATFMYEFAWRSPQMGGRLGAAHGVEIPFVFDTLGLGTEPMLGRDPPQPLADAMHASRVGKFCRQWGLRLAPLRPCPATHDALRPDVQGGQRSIRASASFLEGAFAGPPPLRRRCDAGCPPAAIADQ